MEMGITISNDASVIWDSEYIHTSGTDYQSVGNIIQDLINTYNAASTSNPKTFTLSTQDFT